MTLLKILSLIINIVWLHLNCNKLKKPNNFFLKANNIAIEKKQTNIEKLKKHNLNTKI